MLIRKSKPEFEAIGFDADDTLWENETLFDSVEKRFQALLKDYSANCAEELLKI